MILNWISTLKRNVNMILNRVIVLNETVKWSLLLKESFNRTLIGM